MSLKYYWVDVFGEAPFTGNQLAVCLDAGRLSTEQCQTIAKETNFSETTFIISDKERNGGYDVRIFTPDTELPFAGHPALGTAHVILEKLLNRTSDTVTLNLKVGPIPVALKENADGTELLWMRQPMPQKGERFENSEVVEVLSLDESALHGDWTSRVYSTGVPTLIVPLKDLEALRRSRINDAAYRPFIERNGKLLIMVVSPEGYESGQHFSARVFCHCYGIIEDPATGSANGCFAAYLASEAVGGSQSIDVTVGQGYEIGRPSSLYLQVKTQGAETTVEVGGRALIVGEGVFEI